MAAGTPVISSNAGGIPEVNKHGVTGFIADVGDVDAMVEYTKKLFSDETLLAKMKINAKDNALKFDIANILPLYEELYKEALIKVT